MQTEFDTSSDDLENKIQLEIEPEIIYYNLNSNSNESFIENIELPKNTICKFDRDYRIHPGLFNFIEYNIISNPNNSNFDIIISHLSTDDTIYNCFTSGKSELISDGIALFSIRTYKDNININKIRLFD